MYTHLGIDFGAKLAGTTVICFSKKDSLGLLQCEKKKDSDQWIRDQIVHLNPSQIFIDAPLSIPEAYYGRGSDFHFRACDREVGAMSPMFLGGLTARAMKLKNEFPKISFYETYPKMIARKMDPDSIFYKKEMASFHDLISSRSSLHLPTVENWHQIDAILAWWGGYLYQKEKTISYGNPKEGLIYA